MEVEPIRDMVDVKRFYNWLNVNCTPREAECFLIGCNVALRAGDLLKLKFSDISGKFIELNEQKTGKYKRIPITPVILEAVERLKTYYTSREFYVNKKFEAVYLFQSTGSRAFHLCQPLCIQWLSICFKKASKALEFDYRTTTYLPILEGSSGTIGSTAYTEQSGSYTLIGDRAFVDGIIQPSNLGSWGGNVRISLANLPFVSAGAGYEAQGSVELRSVGYTSGASLTVELGRSSTSKMEIKESATGAASAAVSISDMTTGDFISFSISFKIA